MTAKQGYEVDPDKMRSALKLAESMLEELEQRGYEVPELVNIVSPAGPEDTETNRYISGQRTGARKPAIGSMQAYSEAYNAQTQFLSQLIPNLQSALSTYEANEQSIGETTRATQSQV